jgi:hypothetical protein
MKNIFWKGYSHAERHAAINMIQNAISKYGYLVDFKLFSDTSMGVSIEIDECKIDGLYDELTKIIDLEDFEHLNSTSTKERKVYLNITFSKGTGNLSIEVPAVPG